MAETYAWKGFEYDLPHVAEPVPASVKPDNLNLFWDLRSQQTRSERL